MFSVSGGSFHDRLMKRRCSCNFIANKGTCLCYAHMTVDVFTVPCFLMFAFV